MMDVDSVFQVKRGVRELYDSCTVPEFQSMCVEAISLLDLLDKGQISEFEYKDLSEDITRLEKIQSIMDNIDERVKVQQSVDALATLLKAVIKLL